ncbi:MAG: hypothetical protein ACR2LJ_09135 [Acidimicrobiales bacterium]
MGLATILTLVGTAIIVAALALYLIAISYVLNRVSFRLGTVLIGVRAIVHQVEPVPKYVGILVNDVMAIDQAAQQLLAWGKGPEATARISGMAPMRP